jgi:hypothetical protein
VDESPTLLAALINWTPLIVWLVLMLYIAVLLKRYIRERVAFQKALLEHHTQAIERLAAQTRQP